VNREFWLTIKIWSQTELPDIPEALRMKFETTEYKKIQFDHIKEVLNASINAQLDEG
jgi:hypothetical protein